MSDTLKTGQRVLIPGHVVKGISGMDDFAAPDHIGTIMSNVIQSSAERVRLALAFVNKRQRAIRISNYDEPDWEDSNEAWRRCDEAEIALEMYDDAHTDEASS